MIKWAIVQPESISTMQADVRMKHHDQGGPLEGGDICAEIWAIKRETDTEYEGSVNKGKHLMGGACYFLAQTGEEDVMGDGSVGTRYGAG